MQSHYFPAFYGSFLGPFEGDQNNIQLIYRAEDIHVSLVTLTFTADSISFVDNRYFSHTCSFIGVHACVWVC